MADAGPGAPPSATTALCVAWPPAYHEAPGPRPRAQAMLCDEPPLVTDLGGRLLRPIFEPLESVALTIVAYWSVLLPISARPNGLKCAYNVLSGPLSRTDISKGKCLWHSPAHSGRAVVVHFPWSQKD